MNYQRMKWAAVAALAVIDSLFFLALMAIVSPR